jgi:hypothetical protein
MGQALHALAVHNAALTQQCRQYQAEVEIYQAREEAYRAQVAAFQPLVAFRARAPSAVAYNEGVHGKHSPLDGQEAGGWLAQFNDACGCGGV